MYRKPRFLKVLHAIREQMSREVDYDVDLFAEMIRAGQQPASTSRRRVRAHKNGKPRTIEDGGVAGEGENEIKSRRQAAK
ncbi:MAG TPA: hypothetical protein VGJ55_18830 [Pyrinomonadaceae bacterium]|jgi:hypothetical protein